MAQQLQNITISAPGFFGINTQDSSVEMSPNYASVANNCVIDQFGRIGARKGFTYDTTDPAPLGSSRGIEAMGEFRDSSGNEVVFSAGNNKIFSGTETLTDETPASYTITDNDWKMVNFNDKMYFFQRGHAPLVYEDSAGAVVTMASHASYTGTAPQGHEAIAAFGRLWVADTDSDKHMVYWSDLLIGEAWGNGTSGSIDVSKYWPNGYDEITALAAHNGFLVIFGKRAILIYDGAEAPATMNLVDTVTNIGCVARDSVQSTGSDIVFLSESGVMSLGRLIQEKSAPMRDLSRNVRNDLTSFLSIQTLPIKSVYSAKEAFYLVTLPSSNIVYCFDMRGPLQDGSHRVTTWNGINPLTFLRRADGTLLLGKTAGIATYEGYLDDESSYKLEYFSNPLDFGNAANLKFLKKFNITVIGGQNTRTTFNWAYDYSYAYTTETVTFAGGDIAEFNIDEFAIGEFTTGILINKPSISGSGSGTVVTIGVQADIENRSFSIQKIDILALLGRLL